MFVGNENLHHHALQPVGLVGGDQVIDELVEVAVEHAREIVAREADAVIGDTVLREVIGTNLLAAVARLHLGAAVLTQFFLPLCLLQIPQTRLEDGERLEFVLELRFFVLTGHNQPCWQVRDTYSRVGRVHALTAVTGRTVDIDADIAIFDIDFGVIVGFW